MAATEKDMASPGYWRNVRTSEAMVEKALLGVNGNVSYGVWAAIDPKRDKHRSRVIDDFALLLTRVENDKAD